MRELRSGLLCLAIAAAPATAEVTWTVDTEVNLRHSSYPETNVRGDADDYSEARIFTEITGLFGDKFQLTFTPLVQWDSENRVDGGELDFVDDGIQRPAGTFKEAYATYYGNSFELSIGKKIFTWGMAAGYKPTDNINPADLLDPLTAEKLGVPALSFYKFGDKIDFEIVAMPVFTPQRLPSTDNRWVIIPGESQIRDQIADPVFSVDRLLPPNNADNVQGGIRLRSSSLVSGWDLELSAFRGFDTFGILELIDVQPPTIRVDLLYPEYYEMGAGFSTTRGSFEYHAEVAYHQTRVDLQDDDYWQYVAGFVYTREMGGALDRLLYTLEYLGESVTRDRPADSPFVNTGFDRVLTDTVLTAISLVFSEDTSLDFGGTVNFADESDAFEIALTHRFASHLQVKAGYDSFSGDDGSFYGNWRDNDRFFFHTNWFF